MLTKTITLPSAIAFKNENNGIINLDFVEENSHNQAFTYLNPPPATKFPPYFLAAGKVWPSREVSQVSLEIGFGNGEEKRE